MMRWKGHMECTEKTRNVYKNVGKKRLGRTKHRWEDIIKTGPKETW
jgi:hypothetical protein